MLDEHPDWNRTKLSEELCKLWDWKSDVGQLKDISCRDVLRALDADGQITLPPKKKRGTLKGRNNREGIQLCFFNAAQPAPIEARLKAVAPVIVEIADAREKIGEFKSFIGQYHYLGYGQSVGECMRYMVRSRDGDPLACLMFGSSAWRCAPRDKYIGWADEERRANLHLTTNNTRFLILPWVRIPYLASHLLSVISRRVSQDWQMKYGHPLHLLETFVERGRFAGTCYKAANWMRIGETTGRGRDSVSARAVLPIKDVYVYPLAMDYREKLAGHTVPGQWKAGGK
ncbi:MAG: DUF4338 domain-containing protein [Clostridiales bacterium]|nr:DUF4338 domain-containing protein [Clostridiales bacterium]